MTDEAKALVERLRDDLPQTLIEKHWVDDHDAIYKQREEAADLIETQAREIERLRGVLKRWQCSGCPDCSGDCGSANPPVMCCIMEETRAALAGDSHDQ